MILYLSNFLAKKGAIPVSAYEVCEGLSEEWQVKKYGTHSHPMIRLMQMMFGIVWNAKKTNQVIIDVYSSKAFQFAYYCGLLCQKLQIPYILVIRGGMIEQRLKEDKEKVQKIFSKAHRIIAPSMFMKSTVEKYGYQAIYIPNHIPLKSYIYRQKKHPEYKILWVRSLQKIYNPEKAVEIIALLVRKYPEIHLYFAGNDKDGSAARIAETASKLGVLSHITLCGLLTKKEWHGLAAQCDLLLNPTSADNFPVSVLESMALGLPVVCSNAGGLPDLVSDGQEGCIISDGQANSYAQAILDIYTKSLLPIYSENARKKAEQYSWEAVKRKWLEVLK